MEVNFVLGVFWYAAFVFSLVIHEAAHALAALKLGDKTAYSGGFLTLDPYPHIRREPFGMLVLPIISFLFNGWMLGWASVPYNPESLRHNPKKEAIMSLAGPMANLFLAILAGGLIVFGSSAGVFHVPARISFNQLVTGNESSIFIGFASFLSILFNLNLCLFVFNLIPVPPLDGASIIALVMKRDTYLRFQSKIFNPRFGIFGLLIAWYSFDIIFSPIYHIAMKLIYAMM